MKGQKERREPTIVMGVIKINVYRAPQKNLGGNSGERRRDVIIQIPDFRKSKFILEENMIQAVTILILACIGNKL